MYARLPAFTGARPYIDLVPATDSKFGPYTPEDWEWNRNGKSADERTRRWKVDGTQKEFLKRGFRKDGVCSVNGDRSGSTTSFEGCRIDCSQYTTENPFGGRVDIVHLLTDPRDDMMNICSTSLPLNHERYGDSIAITRPALHYAIPAWKSLDKQFLYGHEVTNDIARENLEWYWDKVLQKSQSATSQESLPVPWEEGSTAPMPNSDGSPNERASNRLEYAPSFISAYKLQSRFNSAHGNAKQLKFHPVKDWKSKGSFYSASVSPSCVYSENAEIQNQATAYVINSGGSDPNEEDPRDAQSHAEDQDEVPFDSAVHKFTLEWTPTKMVWKYDDVKIMSIDSSQEDEKVDLLNTIPCSDMRLMIGMEVGGTLHGDYKSISNTFRK